MRKMNNPKKMCVFMMTAAIHIAATGQTVTLTYNNTSVTTWNFAESDSRTISIPASSTNIIGTAWGGGGGGGGAKSNGLAAAAGGGSAGAYSSKNFGSAASTKVYSMSISVGRAGCRGESSPLRDGGNGGSSTIDYAFFTQVKAGGGYGGKQINQSGLSTGKGGAQSAVGTALGGDVNQNGGIGAAAVTQSLTVQSGAGGKCPNGGAGGASQGATNNYGAPGGFPGGGGSGGRCLDTDIPGGAGGGGRVVISYDVAMPIISGANIYCKGSTIMLTTSHPVGGGVTLQWYKDGNIIPGQTGQTLTIGNSSTSNAGTYTVRAVYNVDYSGVSSISVNGLPGIAVNGTTLSGALTSNSIPVLVNSTDVTFNPIAPLCEDAGVIDLRAYVSTQGGTFSGTGVSGATFTPTIAQMGSNQITYTVAKDGCIASATIEIAVEFCPCKADFKLLHFSATQNDNQEIHVQWATTSQINDELFTLYRSIDGENFTEITTVEGKACAPDAFLDYDFRDEAYETIVYDESSLSFQSVRSPMVYYRLTHRCISSNKASDLIEHANVSISLLPVELSHFTAEAVASNTTHITWETKTETNNDYFSLQRSFNGMDFTETAVITGAGTSATAHRYDYFDHSTFATQTVYYKLVQVDYNKTKTSSNIITVHTEIDDEKFAITKLHTNGTVAMEIRLPSEEHYIINVYSLHHKLIHSQKVINTENEIIHLPVISKGTYVVECVGNNKKYTQKIQL